MRQVIGIYLFNVPWQGYYKLWKILFSYINPSIISHNIQVWHFTATGGIEKVSVAAQNSLFTVGSYIYPYILQSVSYPAEASEEVDPVDDQVNPDDDQIDPEDEPSEPKTITSVTIWKHSLNPLEIHLYREIPDIDKYFSLINGTFRIDETLFINGVFILTCTVPVSIGGSEHETLAIRVVGEDGVMLKECLMHHYNPYAYIAYFAFESRLVIRVDDDTFICLNSIPDLMNPDSKSVFQFRRLDALAGENDIMLRKLQASTVSVRHLAGGRNTLLLKTFDFWRYVYPDPNLEEEIRYMARMSIQTEESDFDEGAPVDNL